LWVNLYVPSKLNWSEKKLELEQSGNFPMDTCVEFTVSTKKTTSFALQLFIPSRAKKVDVYLNNEKQIAQTSPDSYLRLSRQWKNNDKIKLVFHYDFYLKSMPDDKNVIAIFYGPNLLAFENSAELILKGDTTTILNHLTKDKGNNIFHLKNNGIDYLLKPLYDIDEQSYGVYATIRNY